MARIPESEIERIKAVTDLAALVRSRGIELKNHGNGHYIGICPFHDDDEPSFIVTPGKGLFHCMGCGVAGNPIQFVEKFDGVSFRHAFELLNDGQTAFSKPNDGDGVTRKSTAHRLKPPVKPDAGDAELLEQTVDYYHRQLMSPAGEDARQYLKTRGLLDIEALQTFKIGYADRTLGLRLPHKNRKDGRTMREKLERVGLLRKSGHEHFNGCLVLPIRDRAGGSIVEIYGRKIRKVKSPQPKHLYLPGPHAGIWNMGRTINDKCGTMNGEEQKPVAELILCEAPLDALTLYVNGFRNVSFIFGTEGFPEYMLQAIIKSRVKAVRLAYDADPAGDRAAARDAARLTAHGIEVYRVKLPRNLDINSYAVAAKAPREALQQAVAAAEWQEPKPHSRADAPAPVINKSLAANNLAANQKTTSQTHPSRPLRSSVKNPEPDPKHSPFPSLPSVQNNPEPPPTSHSPLSTSHSPQSPKPLTRQGDYHTLTLGSRIYRIGGLDKNNTLDIIKISLRLRHADDFHLDTIDITKDADRRRYIERAAEETGLEKALIKRDIGKLLLTLEETLQERINALNAAEDGTEKAYEMTPEERAEALDFLQSPGLVERITAAFDDCGLVGEEGNRLAAYLACTSRKLDRPLAVIIQSTSAAGKSTLMEAVLAMFPEEERVQYSAMTGQSLYYLGETNLKHHILAIVEEEGAEKAGYALKLLQSEGELTIASTGKNPHSGRMETQEYHVEGPVMIFLTTTAIEIDEELQNRCLTLTVDESREQTERIHTMQRQARTLEGLRIKKRRRKMLTLLRNVQRLLEPLDVVNPYADQLTFTAERTRTRRDHEKYLTLIDAIALLHQHQRKKKTMNCEGGTTNEGRYITVTLDDIELANRLAPELLGRSLDELPPQTRNLLDHIKALVREECRREETEPRLVLFSRRQLREHCGWTEFQTRMHLNRLEALEYIQRRIGSRGRRCVYELLVDIEEPDNAWHIGLLDVDKLRTKKRKSTTTTPTSSTQTGTSGNFVITDARSVTHSEQETCTSKTPTS